MFVSITRDRTRALLDDGLSMAEVARRMGLAYNTVRYHRERLLLPDDSSALTTDDDLPVGPFVMQVSTGGEVRRLLESGHSRAEAARMLGVSKSTVSYHARRFGMEIDERAARRYDWSVIQRYYDAGHSVRECRAKFGFSNATWSQAVKRGDAVGRPTEMPIDQLLAASRNRAHLKGRLVKAGLLATHCHECGLEQWRGRPLTLELHHINGNGRDNRLENLALLCPNCHSQTDSWGGRNGGRRPHLSNASEKAADACEAVPQTDRLAA